MTSGAALAAAVCSIASTQRGKFFWAAWWTDVPSVRPFRKPDASNGGARTAEEARREAEQAAGRPLSVIEPQWARAWMRILRGREPWTSRDEARASGRMPPREPPVHAERASAWTVLGLEPGATPESVKRAFRKRALETHPDRGGDPETFRAVQRAYEKLTRDRRTRPRSGRREKPAR